MGLKDFHFHSVSYIKHKIKLLKIPIHISFLLFFTGPIRLGVKYSQTSKIISVQNWQRARGFYPWTRQVIIDPTTNGFTETIVYLNSRATLGNSFLWRMKWLIVYIVVKLGRQKASCGFSFSQKWKNHKQHHSKKCTVHIFT